MSRVPEGFIFSDTVLGDWQLEHFQGLNKPLTLSVESSRQTAVFENIWSFDSKSKEQACVPRSKYKEVNYCTTLKVHFGKTRHQILNLVRS